jgi:hypothetical protein
MNLQEQKEILKEKLEIIESSLKKKENLNGHGEAKFYHFSQNNSGGSFEENENVCRHVIIEAYSAEDANLRADDIGIYFDGCDMGIDCSCCGDRWHKLEEDDEGTDKPEIYGKDVRKLYKEMFSKDCIIHYLNGKKEHIIFKTAKDCPKHKWKQEYNIGRKCEICHTWESELNDAKAMNNKEVQEK